MAEIKGVDWPPLCDGTHPNQPVMCALLPGPNANVPAVTEPSLDADGRPVGELTVSPARQVHVHKGMAPDGTTHRWEDPPPDQES